MNKYSLELEVQGNRQFIRVLRNGEVCESLNEEFRNDLSDKDRLLKMIEEGKELIEWHKSETIREVVFKSETRTITKISKGKMVWLWLDANNGKDWSNEIILGFKGEERQSFESALNILMNKEFNTNKQIIYETV